MTKPTLLAMCSLFPNQMDALDNDFNVVRLYNEPDPEGALNAVKDMVKGILCSMGNNVSQNLINACPNLEIVACKSVGFDNIDIETAKGKGITVTNTPDLVTNDTADTAIGLLINISRRFVELDAFTRVGRWQSGAKKPISHSLSGKKVGIVGLGRIGQAIATRCEALSMNVVYFGRNPKPKFDYQYYDNLFKMASDVDYLVIAVPGGEKTKGMINADILYALGRDGYLINIARGTVVDESALVHALEKNIIAGAALDVYENEPNVPDQLKTMDNVVLLPHVGANTYETLTDMGELVIEDLRLHFAGKPVKTSVF